MQGIDILDDPRFIPTVGALARERNREIEIMQARMPGITPAQCGDAWLMKKLAEMELYRQDQQPAPSIIYQVPIQPRYFTFINSTK